jgi:putative phosphoribosyl transferase
MRTNSPAPFGVETTVNPERFRNRQDAGKQLAARLAVYAGNPDVTVIGLPRGGVPVAAEIAASLAAPLDIFVVRKLGVPGQSELAMGAIAEGGVEIRNQDVITALGISERDVEEVAARERLELDRRVRLLRGSRIATPLKGRIVILVDDGLATGATMEAAVAAIRSLEPRRLVVAVPVGAADTSRRIAALVDELICVACPEWFGAVGQWYDDFTETTDADVKALLDRR